MKPKERLIIILVVLFLVVSLLNVFMTFTITGTVTVSNEANVSICINPPPRVTAIADQAATVGTAFTYQVVATDPGDSINYTDNTALFNINQSGYISFTPVVADVGTHNLNVTVQSIANASTCVTSEDSTTVAFQLTIADVAAPDALKGGGGSTGAVAAKPAIHPQPSFQLSDVLLKVALKRTRSLEKMITITNDGNINLLIEMGNPLPGIVELSPSSIVLPTEKQARILLVFNPLLNTPPGIYSGILKIIATAEDGSGGQMVEQEIPLVLEIESEEVLVDASLDLSLKSLLPGQALTATISLFNPRSLFPAPVTVIYSISDLRGTVVLEEQENILVNEQVSFTKTFSLPSGLPSGQYLLSLKIISQDSFATASELFAIEKVPLPSIVQKVAQFIEKPALLLSLLPLLIILMIVVLAGIYVLHRRLQKTSSLITSHASATPVKQITSFIQQKIAPARSIIQKVIIKEDDGVLRRKLFLLRQSYEKGYISAGTYRKTKETLLELLNARKK